MLTDFYIAVHNYDVRRLTTHYCLHNVNIVSTLLFCSTHYNGSVVPCMCTSPTTEHNR